MTRLHTSIGALSAAVIAYQLILMHLLSIVQWYHFAYMVISVALLGFGASGTVIALARTWLIDRFESLLPALMMASGASMAWVFGLSQTSVARFDSYLLFVDAAQVASLFLSYLLFFIPFFFAALAIGLTLIKHVEQIGSYYFANLLGSGVGGLVALVLLWNIDAEQLPALAGLLAVLAGLLIIPKRKARIPVALGIFALTLVHVALLVRPEPILSQYKSLSRTLTLPDARIELERNSPQGLLQVVSSSALRFAPGMSLSDPVDIPAQRGVFNNGDWVGPVTAWMPGDSTHILDHTTSALPYVIRKRRSVLALNAGTGDEIAHALANGATRIVVVEPHESLVGLMRSELTEFTDSLFYRDEITVLKLEPRAMLATDSSRYDVITIPAVGAFGGTVGLSAMQEQYLLTTQGLRAMWDRLSSTGALSITVWMDYPYRYILKMLASLVEVLDEAGVKNTADHMVAVRSWGSVTIVVARSAFTADEVERIRAFSSRSSFDPLLLPGLDREERAEFNAVQDERFFEYVDQIFSSERDQLYETYDFDIRPATDNRPYFSRFLRWRHLPQLLDQFGSQTFPFLEVGYLITGVTFIQIFLAALLLIIIPLFRLGWRGPGQAWTISYFGGLGLGYLFVEIVLIQRFTLYLGHPIYATAAVLATLFICSGAGSLFSERLKPERRTVMRAAGFVALILLPYVVFLTPLLQATIALPTVWKVILAFVLIAPPTFFMGIPFPVGLRFLSTRSDAQVPWAWGINGCFSVISTALAAILAVELGFVAVMLFAVAAYGLVAIVSVRTG